MRSRVLRELLNAALIALGILSAAMGLKGFLLSSNFIDGGVTGVWMLLSKTTPRSVDEHRRLLKRLQGVGDADQHGGDVRVRTDTLKRP